MENPLAFDPTNKKQVKIARALQTEFTKAEIKRKLKLTVLNADFGDDSRSNFISSTWRCCTNSPMSI